MTNVISPAQRSQRGSAPEPESATTTRHTTIRCTQNRSTGTCVPSVESTLAPAASRVITRRSFNPRPGPTVVIVDDADGQRLCRTPQWHLVQQAGPSCAAVLVIARPCAYVAEFPQHRPTRPMLRVC